MVRRIAWQVTLVISVTSLAPSLAAASGVHALFDLDPRTTTTSPFPSDRFTVRDKTQNTGLRIDLLIPTDCSIQVSDCQDIDVLNTLDGFNLQPRLSIPFSGPIDVTTVSSDTVLLIKLGSARRRGHHDDDDDDDDDDDGDRDGRSHRPDKIGIDQIVWDVATNTLHVESDELLDQHTRYALIVTRGVKDMDGRSVKASDDFERFRRGHSHGPKAYRNALLRGLDSARAAGFHHHDIVAASVFTTHSITAILEKIRDQIRATTPASADFVLGGTDRTIRTVFRLSDITAMSVRQEVRTAPPNDFTNPLNLLPRVALLRIVPDAVGTVAFGSYRSPVYLNADRFIPQVGTRTGDPAVHGVDEIFFSLLLPSATATRPRPAGGWPVAIWGPGCCADDNKNGTPFNVAATLADHGIATISINAAGQGLGPRSTLTVVAGGQTVTFPAGGRSIDLNGDGAIGPGEGVDTPAPRTIIFGRDSRRQTIADLMQLVRVIEVGVDADGDGEADLDPSRIYYAGTSAGAVRGVAFATLEPSVRAVALSVPGGALGERLRLSPLARVEVGQELLAERMPSLLNVPGIVNLDGIAVGGPHFNENMPLRNGLALGVQLADGTTHTVQSPVVNTVAGAMDIQRMLEHLEWANMSADPVAFAPYLRKMPLHGGRGTPVILNFAKGDQNMPNPSTTAILRAGDVADQATYYRTDAAIASFGAGPAAPPTGVEKNGHVFFVRMNSPLRTAIARAAQTQVAAFFASDGALTIDPNPVLLSLLSQITPVPPAPPMDLVFETLTRDALPEDLGFIP